MLQTILNIFKIPELRNKVCFTVGLLCIYRVGFHIPLPGMNQQRIKEFFSAQEGSALGQIADYFQIFTGGQLGQSSIFGLGIMPYISAAIIFQLLGTVWDKLAKLQKEGESGRRKINEYTRYATVALCIIQAIFFVGWMLGNQFVYPDFTRGSNLVVFYLMAVLGLTGGTVFLMWLGEQIDAYGIGNGISLIIMAGIVTNMPSAVFYVIQRFKPQASTGSGDLGPAKVIILILAFVFVVAGSILITQGQRRIPIQQAKQTRGRRVYGGQRHYLPLRVNHGGVMPIIFASALMMFPQAIFSSLAARWNFFGIWSQISRAFSVGDYIYELTYIGLIFFFAYFWTTVQFRPKEMADQLRDYGSFIPGLRPGKNTADYLERVMERITYAGAAFLAVIAVIPTVVTGLMGIPFNVSTFLGGTGLLIVVSVALDLVQRVEANLLMRHYDGFLGPGGAPIKGAYA